jgi:homoserine kinase type II
MPEIDKSIKRASAHWNLRVANICRDIQVAGSPERCELRFVIECDDGGIYLIESVFESDLNRKRMIIDCLNHLSRKGLSGINTYIRHVKNEYITSCDGRFWQLSPFISGTVLRRPEYVFDKWRGRVMARFLTELGEKSAGLAGLIRPEIFSIKDYIYRLLCQMKENDPDVPDKIGTVLCFLEKRFMDVHDRLPVSFCHGDFHPLNIIWTDDSIKAVIDWEFMGIKPGIYDAANLVGCIGMENPGGLTGELVCDFITALKEAGLIAGLSREFFHEFVVALRFAWLSEWLRHRDREMVELEITYMNLLADNAEMLKTVWKI